jgi:acyl carrier protein
VLLSGEEIKPHELTNWYDTFAERIQLVNLFGPTETTLVKACCFICRGDAHRDKIPIGKPMRGSRIILLDKKMNICPRGIIGEIYIKTPYMTMGYCNQPELNNEKFIRDPFKTGADASALIYKTGDLGRELADGSFEFIGRIDRQVKIRGIRIELGEIESALLKHQEIQQAVVLTGKHEKGEIYLCAYIVAKMEFPVSELREYLSNRLPASMIPSYFVQLESIPLTPNRKIDKKALPVPRIEMGEHDSAPRDTVEMRLVDIWSQLLGIEKEKIGIDANFFELGGHSLKAIALVSRLRKEFSAQVSLIKIFEIPTVRQLARYIKSARQAVCGKIEPVEKREYYALSSAQKRMSIFQQFDPEDKNYNMFRVMVIKGNVDRNKLSNVFSRLIARHEILRTSVELLHDEMVQRVHDEVRFQVEYYPLYNINREQKTQDIKVAERQIIMNFLRPFHLDEVPLIRVGLIQTGEKRYILMVDVHHRAGDAISMNILVKEFIALYKGETLPGLSIQYKDFTGWQNRLFQSEYIKKQENYWLNCFKGDIPYVNITTDHPRPEKRRTEAGRIHLEIGKELTYKLDKLALQTGKTLFMVLMAAANILISKYMYTAPGDIIIGLPIAGRPHAELENVLGMFVNMLALRNSPQPHHTFLEFLAEVKKKMLEAYENQDYQFEELVTKLKIERDLSKNPLFDIVFVMDNDDEVIRESEEFEITVEPYPYIYSTARFDLLIYAQSRANGITCSIGYAAALFKKETIEQLIQNYKHILSQAVENPIITLEDIQISSHLLKADDLSQEGERDFNF